jgi:hypothetical protein
MPTTTRTSATRDRPRGLLSLRRSSLPNFDDPLGLFGDGPPNLLKPQAGDPETVTPPTRCETVSQ